MIGRHSGILLHEDTENIFERRIKDFENELKLLHVEIDNLKGRAKKLRYNINYLKNKIKEEQDGDKARNGI